MFTPYQIRSIEQYQLAYAQSVEKPEEFWARIAEHFVWRKKWERDWESVKYCSDRCSKGGRSR